jgi:hypothetical protein
MLDAKNQRVRSADLPTQTPANTRAFGRKRQAAKTALLTHLGNRL